MDMDTDIDGARATALEIAIEIDGRRAPGPEQIATVLRACARAEDAVTPAVVVVHVSGAPAGPWPDGVTVGVINKWEQALRRLEQLPAATVAVASGDCGGPALDALLATDYRIAATSARLVPSRPGAASWPGMALYRMTRQGSAADAVRRSVLFGSPITMAEALPVSLVHEVTDDPAAAVAAATARVVTVPGAEVALRRQLMLDAQTVGFEDALGVHLAACDRELRRAAAESLS
ncbi:enoyl-CoA-hydratase DpgB [Micromonospora robiginosa]|uniref:Enoyl-CoA-hydratase DpgB n=1 Tax=Micromonospora robiginosa TaxID=2749844 RepID=A0A7L6BFV0_9ACTN|nr:enoyl-CoA-hydratase DpgB [Micromonospora ferruginea]QLQ40520.2 enoyl-CoA-hydratase DpgB [Micromonospora ferruginea]